MPMRLILWHLLFNLSAAVNLPATATGPPTNAYNKGPFKPS